MKQLRTEGELFVKTTRGRYGKTFLTTKSLMMQLIIRTKKEQLDKFQQTLFNLILSTHRVFQKLKERALEQRERAIEQGILHIDTG